MNSKKNRKISIANIIAGYICAIMFLFLIFLNTHKAEPEQIQELEQLTATEADPEEGEVVIFDGISPRRVYIDNNRGEITSTHSRIIREPNAIIEHDPSIDNRDTVIYGHRPNRDLLIDETVINKEYIGDTIGHSESHIGTGGVHRDNHYVNEGGNTHGRHRVNRNEPDRDVDIGLLDRRLAELDKHTGTIEEHVEKDRLNRHKKIGIDKNVDDIDMSNMTLVRDDDDTDLGGIDLDFDKNSGKGYGVGKGGELYAYNYPSRGVGAGIGSSAIGAGAGGGAGLGAAIGEGMLNGEVVPTLGGVGTGSEPLEGQPAGAMPSGGVGGLVGGAGAGGAAGLTQGYVTEKLGLGLGSGQGAGRGGQGGECNYEHLPKDGALHIMMHVDGSGSILNTRKNLDEMKNTLLKEALLPYYKNDEDLYNRRVTIVSSSGERTLRFFNEAAKKDNVLAIAFQDEAQPAYHLPNFNKKPEDHYLDDLKKLEASLNGYAGTYRGVMFQVDRGKTFAKSFKEFLGNAFKGEGYLESANLKKYHRDNNNNNIKNKDGIVFSDEYHAKDSGDPQYYLDLIFKASKRVGLDLNIYGAGLKDGEYKEK